MLQGMAVRLDDALRTAGLRWKLSTGDRALLHSAVGLWMQEATDADAFGWIEAGQLGRLVARETGQPQPKSSVLGEGLLRLGLASVRPVTVDGEQGGRYVVDRYLEIAGQRTVNGRAAAWRVRPGAWLRSQLRQAMVEDAAQPESA